MSANDQIREKADVELAKQLIQILPEILTPDSKTIESATDKFKTLSKEEAFLPTLTQIMVSQETDAPIRQLAAVLFRKRILKRWKNFPKDMQHLVRQASLENLYAADPIISKPLAEIVAGIAEHELGPESDGWPQLMEMLEKAPTATTYEDRLKCTELIKCVCSGAVDAISAKDGLMNNFLQLIGVMLQAADVGAGNKETGQSVHKNLIEAFQSLAPFLEEQHKNVAVALIPRVVIVVKELCDWDDTVGSESLGLFGELCEIEDCVVIDVPMAKQMAEICLKLANEESHEEETRANALWQLQMLIKYKAKAFKKMEIVEPLIGSVIALITSEEDPDDGIMSGVDGDRTIYTGALQVLDQLAMYIPADKVINTTASKIIELLEDGKENHQRAGLLILAVIVEGCADLIMANYMTELVPVVCKHLGNASPNVRSAAYFTLGQFSEHLQPDIADYVGDIMPHLLQIIQAGKNCPEFSNRDVITKVYYALETFVESLGQKPGGIDPYLPKLMPSLLAGIAPESNQNVKETYMIECIVGAIGAVAAASEKKFQPYLEQTLLVLKVYFPDEKTLKKLDELDEEADEEFVDKSILWSRAIATLGSIARGAGAEAFAPYAESTLKMAVNLSKHTTDPDIQSGAFELFGALSSIMKEQMEPFLKMIMEILSEALEEQVLDFTGDTNDEDRVKAIGNMLELSADISEDTDEEALGLNLADVNIESGPIECKIRALETIGELAETCPIAFAPFVQDIYNQCSTIMTLEGALHDEILRATLVTGLTLTSQYFKVGEGNNDSKIMEQAAEMSMEVWPVVLKTIRETNERTVCMSLLYNLEKSIKMIGKVLFQKEEVVKVVIEAAMQVLTNATNCQNEDEGDEQDQSEHDQLLFEYGCDILPTTCQVLGIEAFKPYFAECYPILKKRIQNEKAGTTRAAALGAIADIMKASGEGLANEFAGELVEVYANCTACKETNVRNNSIYGLGLLMSLGVASCASNYTAILEIFAKVLKEEKQDGVRDQVLGGLSRMIIAVQGNQNVNIAVDPMVSMLMSGLPLKVDPQEIAPVAICLLSYVDKMNKDDAAKLLDCVGSMAENYGDNFDSESILAVAHLLKKFQECQTEAIQTLSDTQMQALQQVVSNA